MNAIANFSETGKIATADAANAIALAEVVKVQAQANLTAEQVLAMQAGSSPHAAQAIASTQQGLSWEQTVKMLQERISDEREQREADQQRRHELDLSMAQNTSRHTTQHGHAGRK